MQTMDFLVASFYEWEKSHILCKNNSVRKIFNDVNEGILHIMFPQTPPFLLKYFPGEMRLLYTNTMCKCLGQLWRWQQRLPRAT